MLTAYCLLTYCLPYCLPPFLALCFATPYRFKLEDIKRRIGIVSEEVSGELRGVLSCMCGARLATTLLSL